VSVCAYEKWLYSLDMQVMVFVQFLGCVNFWLLVTETQPDYLANRADQKNDGPLVKQIAQKSRNSLWMSGGGVGT